MKIVSANLQIAWHLISRLLEDAVWTAEVNEVEWDGKMTTAGKMERGKKSKKKNHDRGHLSV